ncbi:unnamed protein product, partial [Phaeothamnion confervicola]
CTRGVSGSADADLHIFGFDLKKANWSVLQTLTPGRGGKPGMSCLEIRDDQKLFAAGGWDHRVRLFSWGRRRPSAPLAVLRCHNGSVHCLDHGPLGSGLLAVGAKDCRLSIWELY